MLLRSLILGASISVMTGSISAQTWSLQVIAPVPPGMQAGAMNDKGEIAIWDSAQQPWTTVEIWSPFGNSQLHVGSPFVAPNVLRYFDNGRAVGFCYEPATGLTHPCAWNSHGQFRRLREPPGAFIGTACDANSLGQIVGSSEHRDGPRPLLWQGDVMTVLPVPNTSQPFGFASAINEHGTIAGAVWNAAGAYEGAFWQGTAGPFLIGVLPGTSGSVLSDITNDGSACGQLFTGTVNGIHAMRYVGGSIVDLGGIPGLPVSYLIRMNRSGVAIGYAFEPLGTEHKAIVTVGSGIELLDDHLDPVSGAGWSVIYAVDINESGQIVADAVSSLTGQGSIVLLTPMP